MIDDDDDEPGSGHRSQRKKRIAAASRGGGSGQKGKGKGSGKFLGQIPRGKSDLYFVSCSCGTTYDDGALMIEWVTSLC